MFIFSYAKHADDKLYRFILLKVLHTVLPVVVMNNIHGGNAIYM